MYNLLIWSSFLMPRILAHGLSVEEAFADSMVHELRAVLREQAAVGRDPLFVPMLGGALERSMPDAAASVSAGGGGRRHRTACGRARERAGAGAGARARERARARSTRSSFLL